MDDLDKIRWLKDGIETAKEQLESFIKDRWPEGSEVHWMYGQHMQFGHVVNSFGDRLKVRNALSSKEYWIDIYMVELALAGVARGQRAVA